jgi:hypothetical protein
VQGCRTRGVEIIHHQSDFAQLRIALLEHPCDELSLAVAFACFGDFNVSPPSKEFHFNEDVGYSFSDLLVILCANLSARH